MTKKRFLKLTLIFMVLLYIVSSAFLFFVKYKNNENVFNKDVAEISSKLKNEENLLGSDSVQLSLNQDLENSSLNGVFAIINSDGKIIAKSSRYFLAARTSNLVGLLNNKCRWWIDLDQYFTGEMYKQIQKDLYKTYPTPLPDKVSICSVSIHKDGDNLIPVEIEFEPSVFSESESDNAPKIKLSDYEPDYTLTKDDGDIFSIDLYKMENESFFYNNAFCNMYENLETVISDFDKKYKDKESLTDNHGIIYELNKNNHYICEYVINDYADIDDVQHTAVLYFEYNNNLIYDTLTSKDYYSLALFMAGFFLITGLIIGIVGSKLIQKNELLNKSRSAFVSAAAHELKTPLAVIANNCECILENVSPEKNMEYVTTVYDESKRMSKMVKSLLEYNKLSTDAKIKKETIDFGEIINREVSSFMPLIESKQIAFSKEMPEKVSLKCDEKLMSMVISNFLSNAVKFTPENGEIKISVAESGGKITFLIFNSGSEISKEDAPHIWEEFYTGSKSRSRDENSTGMGLAVSRAILEMHGFTYGFKNKDNGVIFTFYE